MSELREHMQEKCSDSRERQAARLVTRTGLKVGWAPEDVYIPLFPDEEDWELPPGMIGGVVRPGTYRPR